MAGWTRGLEIWKAMMGRIPDEKIQEIRERTDIVEVVGSYLPLKRSGGNFTGLCPFHAEKTPSFNVNAPRQIFHCFGCNVGGNVFSFLMRMEGLSFPEAVRRLGERAGVAVEEEEASPAELKHRQERQRLTRINEVASEFYHRILMEEAEGEPARRYLKERGYGRETARLFRLGFAPGRWSALTEHLAGKGFDPRGARDLGLIRSGKEGRDFDFFRNRLIFPIMDAGGAVVAFGGRVLDGSMPKYLNSSESAVYHKSRVLYGLYQAREEMRKSGEAIVVEGYFDQLALVRAGFPQAVASCGTALTAEHAKLLKRYAGRVLLLFDQDSAGRKATFQAMDVLLSEGMPAAVVHLDAGEDPDSFLRRLGSEPFRKRLGAARPVLEYFMDTVLSEHGNSIEGKARAVEVITAKLRLLQSDIERALYLKDLAGRTGIEPELLIGRSSMARPDRSLQVPRPRQRGEVKTRGADFKAQEWLLYLMLTDEPSRRRVALEGEETLFFDENCLAVARQIIRAAGQEEKMDEKRLFDALDEEQKAILSGILIKDEKAFADDAARIFEDCRLSAAKASLKRRFRELSDLLRNGGGSSEDGRAHLQRELIEIKKQLEAR